MDVADIKAAADVLVDVGELVEGLHPEHRLYSKAVEMRLVLTLASSYLAELALNLAKGLDQTDAILQTVAGDTKLTPESIEAIERAMRRSQN